MAGMLCLCRVITFSCVLLASSVPTVHATACPLCGSNAACHKPPDPRTCSCNCGYHGHPDNCTATDPPLGVSNRTVLPDSQMTASSSLNASKFGPGEGRLHGPSAWCASSNATGEYLQVDLRVPHRVVRIATQGRPSNASSASADFVKSYKLRTSLDGVTWDQYKSGNGSQTDKVFAGNSDGNSVACHVINDSLIARYVQLYPQSSHGQTCLRLELYGGNGKCDNETNSCPGNVSCVNTERGHSCLCGRGFTWDGFNCTDNDECALGIAKCPPSVTCINTAGSYTCACGHGRRWDGSNCTCLHCEDIDECNNGTSPCSPSATCQNTIGSYECSCKDGFTGDGFNCSALDECSLKHCHDNAVCSHTSSGAAECGCRAGFSGDGVHACVDLDECAELRCQQNSSCFNTQGSYYCRCNEGYFGNGTWCVDVDECSGPNNCSRENADCYNTLGSYRCTCRQGYAGNGLCLEKEPEVDTDSSGAAPKKHEVVLITSVVIVGVALVCGASLLLYWRKRRVRKNARPSVTTIGSTQVDQIDDDLSRWRDSASLHSSRYSVAGLAPFSLSLNNIGANSAQPLRPKGDAGGRS